jgi:hypothetical protein
MFKSTTTAALAAGIGLLGLAGFAAPASAATILIFGQNGALPPANFDITNNGNGTTTISATALSVSITALEGPLVPPTISDATFTFSSTSSSAASTFSAFGTTFLVQRFSGTFSVDAPECGTVCLAGTFTDLVSGPVGGRALTIAASQPPLSGVTFTSDVIAADDLVNNLAIALSATNLDVPVSFNCTSPVGCTLGSTSSNISGTFSADPGVVPEPSTWAMMALGFLGLGFFRFRAPRSKLALLD